MTVIVGYIPTPEGEAALERAVSEARLRGWRLVVINSSRGDAYIDPRRVQSDAWHTLEDRLASAGVDHLLVQPELGGDPAHELIHAAEVHQAGLVVIGLRKRSPVGKLIMGSTAQRILLQAECAVLAVKVETHDAPH